MAIIAVLSASIVTPVAAQFQPSSVEFPELSQVIELTSDEIHLRLVARTDDGVIFQRTFNYTPYAGVNLLSTIPGHELAIVHSNEDTYLYDPRLRALSSSLPWPGDRERADPTDLMVNGFDISTDGTRLRIGHLTGMGSIYFFYDISDPLSPVFVGKSERRTWGEIQQKGKPGLSGYQFVDVLTPGDYKPPVLPARQLYRPRSIIGALPALSQLIRQYAPVALIFPVGWSPDGHLGYAQLTMRERPEEIRSRDPLLDWSISWSIQDMVNDRIDVEQRLPIILSYDQERDAGANAFVGIFGDSKLIERGNHVVNFGRFGIKPDQKLDVLPTQPSDGGAVLQTSQGPIRITQEMQRDGERIRSYRLRATLEDGRSKEITHWSQPTPGAEKGGWSVVDVQVVGALASPFDDRIAIIVARTALTESSLRVVDLFLVGCHLSAGYR